MDGVTLNLGSIPRVKALEWPRTTMPANAPVQTRIDSGVKAKAVADLGMTVSEAVRILLTRTANEGALQFRLPRTQRRIAFGSAPGFRRPSTILARLSPTIM